MGTKHVFLVFVDKKWPSKIVNKQAQYLDYKRKRKKKTTKACCGEGMDREESRKDGG